MKIGFYTKVNSFWIQEVEKLKKMFSEHEFLIDENEINENLSEIEVIVGGKLQLDFIDKAKNLKVIFVPFAGVNHLPLDYLFKRGIKITNAHGNARYVAERAISLTMAFYNKIIDYHNDLKQLKWHGFWVGRGLDDTWESIRDKTIVILGAGAIGHYIAKFMKIFNATVYGYKKRKVEKLPEYYDKIFYDIREAIDNDCEIVFNALPLTPETQNIINEDILKLMKNKVFVNVGRGGSVDEKALYEYLKSGYLKGAAIDAWYKYPESGSTVGEPSNYPYWELNNVVLSPHIAGFTSGAVRENAIQTIENLKYFLKNGVLKKEVKYY